MFDTRTNNFGMWALAPHLTQPLPKKIKTEDEKKKSMSFLRSVHPAHMLLTVECQIKPLSARHLLTILRYQRRDSYDESWFVASSEPHFRSQQSDGTCRREYLVYIGELD